MVQMVSYFNSSCSLIRPCYTYMHGSRDWAGCIQSWKFLYIKILKLESHLNAISCNLSVVLIQYFNIEKYLKMLAEP